LLFFTGAAGIVAVCLPSYFLGVPNSLGEQDLDAATSVIPWTVPCVAFDAFYIASSRYGLEWMQRGNSMARIGIFCLLNTIVLLAAFLVLLILAVGAPFKTGNAILLLVGVPLVVSLIVLAVLLCVLLAAILHRLAWPAFDRLLYSAARHEVVKRRKFLASTGLALIAVAVTSASSLRAIGLAAGKVIARVFSPD
jgi:hypothetical protein